MTASRRRAQARGPVYLDASALAKLYLPETESDALEKALIRRRDIWVSDLAVTEVISAIARRKREGHLTGDQVSSLHTALVDDLSDETFLGVSLEPAIHREAERLLIGLDVHSLRALDALHLALALSVSARSVMTFDQRLREAARASGLHVWPAV